MNNIKEKIKENKCLYKVLYPLVYKVRYFWHADCRTAWFFFKYFLRMIHIIPRDKHLVELEDKYKGQNKRAFVIATGPSLTIEDLNWLHENNELCISCNDICWIYDKTEWRPDYYIMNDDRGYEPTARGHKDFIFDDKAKEKVFLPDEMKHNLPYKPDRNKVGFIPICYFDHWIVRPGRFKKYSRDIKNACYDLYTVTNTLIAFADYIGVKEIYLLGVDCNYYMTQAHVGDDGDPVDFSKLTIEEREKYLTDTEQNYMVGFREAKIGCEKNGVTIYNATRGGSLEVYQRVDMDDIIAGKI